MRMIRQIEVKRYFVYSTYFNVSHKDFRKYNIFYIYTCEVANYLIFLFFCQSMKHFFRACLRSREMLHFPMANFRFSTAGCVWLEFETWEIFNNPASHMSIWKNTEKKRTLKILVFWFSKTLSYTIFHREKPLCLVFPKT